MTPNAFRKFVTTQCEEMIEKLVNTDDDEVGQAAIVELVHQLGFKSILDPELQKNDYDE